MAWWYNYNRFVSLIRMLTVVAIATYRRAIVILMADNMAIYIARTDWPERVHCSMPDKLLPCM